MSPQKLLRKDLGERGGEVAARVWEKVTDRLKVIASNMLSSVFDYDIMSRCPFPLSISGLKEQSQIESRQLFHDSVKFYKITTTTTIHLFFQSWSRSTSS